MFLELQKLFLAIQWQIYNKGPEGPDSPPPQCTYQTREMLSNLMTNNFGAEIDTTEQRFHIGK